MNKLSNLTRGIIKENPVLVLLLGTCPTLATSTQAKNAIGMGLAATVVLICSNIAISALRKIIPDKVRIPSYIVVIAGFVTVVQMVVKAYAPALDKSLGIYLSLIVVNCIILGRAEAYACNHSVGESALDGLQMGIAYTCSLLCMAIIRQILGTGALALSNPFNSAVIFSLRIIPESYVIPFMTEQTGSFFTFACLAAAVAAYKEGLGKKSEKKEAK